MRLWPRLLAWWHWRFHSDRYGQIFGRQHFCMQCRRDYPSRWRAGVNL